MAWILYDCWILTCVNRRHHNWKKIPSNAGPLGRSRETKETGNTISGHTEIKKARAELTSTAEKVKWLMEPKKPVKPASNMLL